MLFRRLPHQKYVWTDGVQCEKQIDSAEKCWRRWPTCYVWRRHITGNCLPEEASDRPILCEKHSNPICGPPSSAGKSCPKESETANGEKSLIGKVSNAFVERTESRTKFWQFLGGTLFSRGGDTVTGAELCLVGLGRMVAPWSTMPRIDASSGEVIVLYSRKYNTWYRGSGLKFHGA